MKHKKTLRVGNKNMNKWEYKIIEFTYYKITKFI